MSNSTFATALKYADLSLIFANNTKTDVENYRPISILPTLSAVHESLMHNQLYLDLDEIVSKLQRGFREGLNVQHCLSYINEKLHKPLDNGSHMGALLEDLSKAFDCIKHTNLFSLLAKQNAYGMNKSSLNFICSYVTKKTKNKYILSL